MSDLRSERERKLRDQETGIVVVGSFIAFLFGYPLLMSWVGHWLGMGSDLTIAVAFFLPTVVMISMAAR